MLEDPTKREYEGYKRNVSERLAVRQYDDDDNVEVTRLDKKPLPIMPAQCDSDYDDELDDERDIKEHVETEEVLETNEKEDE